MAGDSRPRLMVSSHCPNLVNEFYEYRWEEHRDGRNDREAPRKEHDHAMDALRYMVMAVDSPATYSAMPLPGTGGGGDGILPREEWDGDAPEEPF